jgi:DNA-binding NtrC family response regulator
MSPSNYGVGCGARSAAIVASANKEFRKRIFEWLAPRRWTVEEAMGGAEVLSRVEEGAFRAILLDRWLPDLDVQELVEIIKVRHPDLQVLVLGSEAEERFLVERLSLHAGSPLEFPDAPDSMEWGIGAEGSKDDPAGAARIAAEVKQGEPLPGMMGTSEAMQQAFRLARLVIPRNTTVLIMGETGTGKELMARAIHNLGPRAQHPFIIVNCAAIPEPLLESELFGHTRGAFTGAFQSRLGRIHSAHGGTLFLDEVGELPLSMQAKLLRFLQGGEVQRLGSPDVFQVDVRVIAATNADLTRAIAAGQFNDALYYRLSVFPIELAPLRERKEDILCLASHFLDSLCREAGVPSKSISFEVAKALEDYAWPGNVRELEHVIERAFILSENGSVLRPAHVNLAI